MLSFEMFAIKKIFLKIWTTINFNLIYSLLIKRNPLKIKSLIN